MHEKSIRLNQLVTIRDLLRRKWTLGELHQDGEHVYFTNGGSRYRIRQDGGLDIHGDWAFHSSRESIRIPQGRGY